LTAFGRRFAIVRGVFMYRSSFLVLCLSVCTPSFARAQGLTLDAALQQARASAPLLIAVRARIDEARARLIDASQRWREQTLLEGGVGPRRGAGTSSVDSELAIEQIFETGGQRGARIAVAEANIDRETAVAEDATRRHLRDVAVAYLTAVGSDERRALVRNSQNLATELLRATERRFALGDVAAMDMNLARIAVARAEADASDAEADYEAAIGSLRRLIGASADLPVTLAGTLGEYANRFQPAVLGSIEDRPELRLLNAERRAADSELELGSAMGKPDVGGRFTYEREEGDQVVLAGFSIRLPFVDRGAALRAEATARQRRVDLERQAIRLSLQSEVATARQVYERLIRAARAIETTALPAVADNESLATKSYEAGQIGLLDLLLLRREAVDIRQVHLDHLLDAAIAGVELAAATGGLR
jgi:cobalt-zinc-cadmium efflux system outer membrane protein